MYRYNYVSKTGPTIYFSKNLLNLLCIILYLIYDTRKGLIDMNLFM